MVGVLVIVGESVVVGVLVIVEVRVGVIGVEVLEGVLVNVAVGIGVFVAVEVDEAEGVMEGVMVWVGSAEIGPTPPDTRETLNFSTTPSCEVVIFKFGHSAAKKGRISG